MLNLFIILLLFYNEVSTYRVHNSEQVDGQDSNTKYNLLDALSDLAKPSDGEQDNVSRKKSIFEEALQHWTGRWMPDKDPVPTPASKLNSDHGSGSRTNPMDDYSQKKSAFEEALEHWTGRWMPDKDPMPTPAPNLKSDYSSGPHRVPMGSSDNCDDGKTNLDIDWNYSAVNYTCYGDKIVPDYSIDAIMYCERIPEYYMAAHACMNDTLNYDDDIPLYGTHRPVWPVYGEYKFLPRQRWLHSIEHGAVAVLYHPCANPLEVKRLKSIVKSCLRRYVMTPYSFLNEDRPLALVTWGCRLTMSYINPDVIRNYIRNKALRGPEFISVDGEYDEGLISKATVVSNIDDSILCPQS